MDLPGTVGPERLPTAPQARGWTDRWASTGALQAITPQARGWTDRPQAPTAARQPRRRGRQGHQAPFPRRKAAPPLHFTGEAGALTLVRPTTGGTRSGSGTLSRKARRGHHFVPGREEYYPGGPKTPENAPCGPKRACWGQGQTRKHRERRMAEPRKLQELSVVRARVEARIERFGPHRSPKGHDLRTVLLTSIVSAATGELLTEHLWFTCGRWSEALRRGDHVLFNALRAAGEDLLQQQDTQAGAQADTAHPVTVGGRSTFAAPCDDLRSETANASWQRTPSCRSPPSTTAPGRTGSPHCRSASGRGHPSTSPASPASSAADALTPTSTGSGIPPCGTATKGPMLSSNATSTSTPMKSTENARLSSYSPGASRTRGQGPTARGMKHRPSRGQENGGTGPGQEIC